MTTNTDLSHNGPFRIILTDDRGNSGDWLWAVEHAALDGAHTTVWETVLTGRQREPHDAAQHAAASLERLRDALALLALVAEVRAKADEPRPVRLPPGPRERRS